MALTGRPQLQDTLDNWRAMNGPAHYRAAGRLLEEAESGEGSSPRTLWCEAGEAARGPGAGRRNCAELGRSGMGRSRWPQVQYISLQRRLGARHYYRIFRWHDDLGGAGAFTAPEAVDHQDAQLHRLLAGPTLGPTSGPHRHGASSSVFAMADWGKLLGDQRGREGGEDDDGNRAGVLGLVHPVMVSDAVCGAFT